MSNPHTTFIVGAGASAEYDFPVGSKLLSDIRKLVDFDHDIYSQSNLTQDQKQFVSAINSLHVKFDTLKEIKDQIIYADSIDRYISRFNDDAKKQDVCKIAICLKLFKSEHNCYSDDRGLLKDEFWVSESSRGWLFKFFKYLTRRISTSDLDSVFENISIICFNYDRCIEFFLWNMLQRAYGITAERASELILKLNIVHPYGSLGTLPFQAGRRIAFGIEYPNLNNVYKEIKTFSEAVEDNEINYIISKSMWDAGTIVFLGFSFGQENIKLISQANSSIVQGSYSKKVYATAFGVHAPNVEAFKARINSLFPASMNIYVEVSPLTCSDFFDHYTEAISR